MNENFLEHNLNELRKCHEYSFGISDLLSKLQNSSYQLEQAESGDAILKVQVNKDQVIHIGDQKNPRNEALSCIPNIKNEKNLFVVMGMGLGYLLFELIEKYPESHFLVIEHDPNIFKKAMEAFDFRGLIQDERIEFCVGLKGEYLLKYFKQYFVSNKNYLYLPNLNIVKDDKVVALSQGYYQEVANAINTSVSYFWDAYIGDNIEDDFGALELILENMNYYDKWTHIKPYLNKFKDYTGVVVSSGPSLTAQLEELKKIQDKAIIICADSALEKLLDYGIVPFGVTCVERDVINGEYFKGFKIPEEVSLFCLPLIQTATIKNFPGPIVPVYRHSFPFGFLPEYTELYNFGLSCAHLSYFALKLLGCKNIALVGQDLAYDPHTGSSHYLGIHESATNQFEHPTMKRVSDVSNCGKAIDSTFTWVLFRDMFQEMILEARSQSHTINVIPKDYGLKIIGAEQIEPRHFYQQGSYFKKFSSQMAPSSEGYKYSQSLKENFFREYNELLKILFQDLNFMLSEFQMIEKFESYSDYEKLYQKIDSKIHPKSKSLIYTLIKPHLIRIDIGGFSLWSQEEFQEQQGHYLKKIIDALILTRNLIKKYAE